MNTNNEQLISKIPIIGDEQIELLERLSNACGVSGAEEEVRQIVLEQVKPYADEITIDALGNVLVWRKGKNPDSMKVMLAAHMDEVGLMLVDSDEGGTFSFEIVGGIDERQLVGKAVWVGKKHTPGVIGSRPIHLEDDLSRKIPVKSLKIDLGPGGNDKAKPGDHACFATPFQKVGPSLIGKALDDRIGVATLIELVKNAPYEVDLCAAFTVQEEVGLRGARVAAYSFNPDVGIALDSTPANDLPTWDEEENVFYNTRLGFGAAIYIADNATLSDPRLIKFFTSLAEEYNIQYQVRQPGTGGTDAGAIHKQRMGIPSVSISVPGRNAHSAVGIARISDWQSQLSWLFLALNRMNKSILQR